VAIAVHIRRWFGGSLLSAALTLPAQAQITFTGLGVSPGVATNAAALSADASTVVGWRTDGSGPSPPGIGFRWTAGSGRTDLPPSAGFTDSVARAVSSNGSLAAGYVSSASGAIAARWAAGVPQTLGTLPGGLTSLGSAISRDGSIVLGNSDVGGGNSHAFRWTQAGGMSDLGTLPGFASSGALAISADNSVIVGAATNAGSPRAFRWTQAGGITDLGILSGQSNSSANDVSADGSIIVGTSGDYAFRWTQAGGMQPLYGPAGNFGSAGAITPDGSVIVGSFRSTGQFPVAHAAVWTNAGVFDFSAQILGSALPAGWTLSGITDVSDDGRTFTGTGNHNGVTEAWVATIPAPGAASFLLVAAARSLRRRR
jgi:probable HAF family extracellular repeat protein